MLSAGSSIRMKCPSCYMTFAAPVEQCPKCKLTLRHLDLKFGAVPRHSSSVTDLTRRLSRRAVSELRTRLRLFNRKFPQCRFSVFLTNQIPGGSISEYTFWLMNRGRFGSVEAVAERNFDLLLVIDAETATAALCIGYALEGHVTEHDLERALAGAAGGFHTGDFASGIRTCAEMIMNRLREIVKKLEAI